MRLEAHRGQPPRARACAGLGLVELLVAMTIGLAVLAGVLAVTLKARYAHVALETTARLQELARYALGLIESDVRMGGHLGLLARAELVTNLRAPLTMSIHRIVVTQMKRHAVSPGGTAMDRSLLSIIILIFAVTLCLPSWSFGRRGGTEDSRETGHDHGRWTVPDQEERRTNPVPADKASLEQGANLFKTYCAACHGEKAKGDGPAGAGLTPRPPDLTREAGHDSDGELAWKIATGRPPMPAWKGTLTETQIWHVVNYLKSISTSRARGGREDGGRR